MSTDLCSYLRNEVAEQKGDEASQDEQRSSLTRDGHIGDTRETFMGQTRNAKTDWLQLSLNYLGRVSKAQRGTSFEQNF